MTGERKRRRGIRKYFTQAKKGFRTYGASKRWRTPSAEKNSALNTKADGGASTDHLCKEDSTKTTQTVLRPIVVGFCGFDDPKDPGHCTKTPTMRPLRVLSLFDGISTGFYVLNTKLRLNVEVYYSAEIHRDALQVQVERFHDRITPIGSVCDLTEDMIHGLGRIDLLIGGSPCEDLSLVNPKRKGLFDPSGTGYLFFHYNRVLHHIKNKARGNGEDFWWLFENTTRMEKACVTTISETLGCSPVVHNARTYVPMERARYFWGNIPNLHCVPTGVICPSLQDFLKPGRKALVDFIPTLTTNTSAQRSGPNSSLPALQNGLPTALTVTEEELLFGFPEHYTDCGTLSASKRRSLLGKAWSVHVIEGILTPLRERFQTYHFKVDSHYY